MTKRSTNHYSFLRLVLPTLIKFLFRVFNYSYRNPQTEKTYERGQDTEAGKPEYQESEFSSHGYSRNNTSEANNNQRKKTNLTRNKENCHFNRAFAGDYAHKVMGIPNTKKRPHASQNGLSSPSHNHLIVTPQDSVSACLQSPSSIISLSDDENSSLTDSGVETNSKASREDSRGKREIKKKSNTPRGTNQRLSSPKMQCPSTPIINATKLQTRKDNLDDIIQL